MAYVPVLDPRRRAATLTAVAVVHAGAAALILSGFAGGVIRTIHRHVPVQFWPVDKPVKAPPAATAVAPRPHIANPAPSPHPLPADATTIHYVDIPLAPPSGLDPVPSGSGTADAEPLPSPAASFAPRDPRPVGAPGRWVSNADYPTGAMRRGEQGVTGFAVTIGPDGRVRDCTITRSSGSADLDRAACARITERARFAPATDSAGNQVAGRYANSIRWQIPAD